MRAQLAKPPRCCRLKTRFTRSRAGRARVYLGSESWNMPDPGKAKQVCDEIAGEVRDIASWLAGGSLSPDQFTTAVLTLEEAKIKRFGFTLTALNYADGRTSFDLRWAETKDLCARLNFDPDTGELTVSHHC